MSTARRLILASTALVITPLLVIASMVLVLASGEASTPVAGVAVAIIVVELVAFASALVRSASTR